MSQAARNALDKHLGLKRSGNRVDAGLENRVGQLKEHMGEIDREVKQLARAVTRLCEAYSHPEKPGLSPAAASVQQDPGLAQLTHAIDSRE